MFAFDSSYVDQQEKSPGKRNSAKNLLAEGKMVLINCTRGNDNKFHLEGELKKRAKKQ